MKKAAPARSGLLPELQGIRLFDPDTDGSFVGIQIVDFDRGDAGLHGGFGHLAGHMRDHTRIERLRDHIVERSPEL